MALRSDDLPALPNPAKATLGFTANFLRTSSTISSMPSIAIGSFILPSWASLLYAFLTVPHEAEGQARPDECAGGVGCRGVQVGRTSRHEKLVKLVGEPVGRAEGYGSDHEPDRLHRTGAPEGEEAEPSEDGIRDAVKDLVVGKE